MYTYVYGTYTLSIGQETNDLTHSRGLSVYYIKNPLNLVPVKQRYYLIVFYFIFSHQNTRLDVFVTNVILIITSAYNMQSHCYAMNRIWLQRIRNKRN